MHDRPANVAVIADTHVERLDQLPRELVEELTKADLVIHLGDYTSIELLNDLRKLGNFFGISGNHDERSVRRQLKEYQVIEVCGKKLGLVHGTFWPVGSLSRMRKYFRHHKIDAMLCGHTHLTMNKHIDGCFVFNPGSVLGKFPATTCSFGMLTVDGTVSGQIVPLVNQVAENPCCGYWARLISRIVTRGIRWLEAWPWWSVWYNATRIGLAMKRAALFPLPRAWKRAER